MDIQRYAIKLDMKSVGAVDTGIRLKQGDAGMIFDFYIYNNGKLWSDENDRPSVVFNKQDKNIVYGYANPNGNAYSYTILGEELTAAGTVTADVKFTLDNGRESTRTFTFYVEPDTLGASAHESKSVISPIEKAVKDITETYLPQVEKAVSDAEGYAEDAKEAAESAEGANAIDFDEETRILTLKNNDRVLDECEISGGGEGNAFMPFENEADFESKYEEGEVPPNTSIYINDETKAPEDPLLHRTDVASISEIKAGTPYTNKIATAKDAFDLDARVNELNSNIKWKKMGSVTGKTNFTFTHEFDELYISAKSSASTVTFNANVLYAELSATNKQYEAGCGHASGFSGMEFYVSTSKFLLNWFFVGNSDYTTTTTVDIYYR